MPTSGRPCSRLAFVESWAGHTDRPALITDQETITYRELDARVATEMELLGSTRRLVLIELQNTVPAIVSYLAAMRAGHVVLIASDERSRESLTKNMTPMSWSDPTPTPVGGLSSIERAPAMICILIWPC